MNVNLKAKNDINDILLNSIRCKHHPRNNSVNPHFRVVLVKV